MTNLTMIFLFNIMTSPYLFYIYRKFSVPFIEKKYHLLEIQRRKVQNDIHNLEFYRTVFPYSQDKRQERACLLRALMCQAVLWGIKNGCRATKILMNDFFSIPLHLAKKKFFFDPPCWCCLTGGRGESAFWGVSDVG